MAFTSCDMYLSWHSHLVTCISLYIYVKAGQTSPHRAYAYYIINTVLKTYVPIIRYIHNYIEKVSGNLSLSNPIDQELYQKMHRTKQKLWRQPPVLGDEPILGRNSDFCGQLTCDHELWNFSNDLDLQLLNHLCQCEWFAPQAHGATWRVWSNHHRRLQVQMVEHAAESICPLHPSITD